MAQANHVPEERPRRRLKSEEVADESTFTEESPIDEEGDANSEEEQADTGEPLSKRRGKTSEEAA